MERDYMTFPKKKETKNLWIALIAIAIYFILPYFKTVPFLLVGLDPATLPNYVQSIYLMFFELLMMALILMLYKDKLIHDWKDLKKHHMDYFKKYIKYWILALIIMMGSNIIISALNQGGIAGNEESVREIFGSSPIYMFFSAVLFAPVVEELIFRQSIRNIFPKTTWLFILFSGLIFGFLHVVNNVEHFVDILYLIPYSAPGFMFAYMLAKSDNIFIPMGFHFMHNGIMMSLQVLLLLLG